MTRGLFLLSCTSSKLYEELEDPGDWEALKRELDPNKETIVTADLSSPEEMKDHPFKSIPDPWSWNG